MAISNGRPRDSLDIVTRKLWREEAAGLVQFALGDPGIDVQALLDPARLLVRRDVDGLARVSGPHGPFVFHAEFEASPKPARVSERIALVGMILRHQLQLPVLSVVYLLDRPSRMKGEFRMAIGPLEICTYRFQVVRIYDTPAEVLAADPATSVFAPLGARATLSHVEQAQTTIRQCLHGEAQADRLAELYIVSGRRFPNVSLQSVFNEEELMESVTYLDILNKGFEKGIEKGIEKGFEKGIEKGLATGVERGSLLGRQQALLQVVQRLLTARGVEANTFDADLARRDAEGLDALAEALIRGDDLASIRAALWPVR